MKKFIQQNSIFLSLYLTFAVTGGWLIIAYESGTEILYASKLHTPAFDFLFKWITKVAEAPAMILLLLVYWRFGITKGLLLTVNTLLVFAITIALKYGVFNDSIRPSVFFEGKAHLNFVEGVEIYRQHSFPSGHTSTAFGLFFMLSILTLNKKWSWLFFALALLVGISRVYLLEHFFRDIYFGAAVGVLVTLGFYFVIIQTGIDKKIPWRTKDELE